MILEFFRLVKNIIQIRRGSNGFYLVVDSGASTTNFTIVMSTRAGQITEAVKKRRAHNLRAISFDAALLAGRAVDGQILDRLAPDLQDVPPSLRDNALMWVEQAKLEVARTGSAATISLPVGRTALLSPETLGNVTSWLWASLASSYQRVAEALLEQLQSGAGKKRYGPMLAERGIRQANDVARLFDAVFLAGGTSLLPGFSKELRKAVDLPLETPIHSVGRAYPVAAAIGGLAHALTPRRSMPNSEDGAIASEEENESDFTSSLACNLILDCQDKKGVASTPNPKGSPQEGLTDGGAR
jgi:hypothetical protein